MEGGVGRGARIRVGDPLDPATQMGAQASEEQLKKILSYIEVGKQEGAKCVTGGSRAHLGGDLEKGYFLQPTVFVGDNGMRIFQEEIFVPLLSLTTFKNVEDAIRIGNDTVYGLGAGVASRNGSNAYRIGRGIQAGRGWTNFYHAHPAHAAFGGHKGTGFGRAAHEMMLHHHHETQKLTCSYSNKALR